MKKQLTSSLIMVLVTAIIILLNILASRHSAQFDLTFDRRYTLSPASEKVLSGLVDPVTVKAYFSEDLPAPYNSLSTYVQDLLNQYYNHSHGLVRYQFIDPALTGNDEPEQESATAQNDLFGRPARTGSHLENELLAKGIMPVRLRVNEDDKLEERVVYMALELLYGENSEVIPLVQDVSKLEYNITSTIRTMSRDTRPKVGLLKGHGELDENSGMGKFLNIASAQYELVPLELSGDKAQIPEDIAAIIVLGPRNTIDENELILLDQFIRSGKGLALLADSMQVNMSDFTARPLEHGLDQLLDLYGLKLEQGIVGDRQGANIGVQQRQGLFVVNQPVKYYYMPLLLRYPENSIISNGLGAIAMAFASPIALTDKGYPQTVIAQSSKDSWRENSSTIDLNPLQNWREKDIKMADAPLPLAVTVEKIPGRLALFGNSYFLDDQFIQESGLNMMLNTIDWLLGDDELLSMRGRGLAIAMLDQDINKNRRGIIKYGNIFGGPLCLLVLGLILYWRREQKRRHLSPNK